MTPTTHRPTADQILWQLGWHRTDTAFASLNLTPDQLRILQRANDLTPQPLEEVICEALEMWIEKRKAKV